MLAVKPTWSILCLLASPQGCLSSHRYCTARRGEHHHGGRWQSGADPGTSKETGAKWEGAGHAWMDMASGYLAATLIFHREKHNIFWRGKKINDAVIGIFVRTKYSVCKYITAFPHAATALPSHEGTQSVSFSSKAKCAACVLKEMHVCAKEKIKRRKVHDLRLVTITLSKPSWRDTAELQTS